ncbi:MAG: fatty acid desaturase [Pseudomonadales bacterium]|nr:fatty acid desaturase [Pseudomonadales bacterium]
MNRAGLRNVPESTEPMIRSESGFSDDFKISWYRSPIDPVLLSELMQRNDFRGWLQTLSHLGYFFLTGGLAYFAFLNIAPSNWYWTLPLLLLALFVHGTMGPFMGLIAVHELMHRTVFKSKQLNAFFERVYAFISWSDYLWYQGSHPPHHGATCHEAYDGEVPLALLAKARIERKKNWFRLLIFNPTATWQKLKLVWRHANGQVHGRWYNHVLPETDPEVRRRHRKWARTLLSGHAVLAATFVVTGHWFLIVVFTFGTFYCGWLGFLCGIPQHYGLNSDVPDFRYNTRTFTCSWLPAFYYWNMQYHLEHHMFPAVPFYNLPKLRAAIAHDLPPANHGLVSTWRELFEIRRRVRENPDYRFVPDVPLARESNTKVTTRQLELPIQTA